MASPPGPKKAPSRVSDAEQQVVARYVDHDTACDDAQPGRTAEPRVMFEQPGGLFCDNSLNTGDHSHNATDDSHNVRMVWYLRESSGIRPNATRRQTNLPTTNSPTDQLADNQIHRQPTRRQTNSPTIQLTDKPTRRT